MARKPRSAAGGIVYHVLNRSAGKFKFLNRDKDFQAFENLLIEAHQRHPLDMFSYCLMGTHWHFVVLPKKDGDLTAFFRWLTHTHAMRWRVSHRTVGYGHLYQGRFKSFPVEEDGHFLNLCRYVERNALTAGMLQEAAKSHTSRRCSIEFGASAFGMSATPGQRGCEFIQFFGLWKKRGPVAGERRVWR